MPSRSHWQRRLNPLLSLSRSEQTAILFICLGAGLRLIFPSTIEYKWDEHLMATLAGHPDSSPDPWLGIPSSQGFRNPGLSVWVFVALHSVLSLFAEVNPITLSMGVGALAVTALVLSVLLAFRTTAHPAKPGQPFIERALLLWIIALTATQPIEILLTRKIWAQSVLPIFCVAFWWALTSLSRITPKSSPVRQFFPAFFFSLLGLALGQIHLSGFFFFVASVAVMSPFLWKLLKSFKKPRALLAGFGAGLIAGLLPMIPWFVHLYSFYKTMGQSPARSLSFGAALAYAKHALCLDLDYSFGPDTKALFAESIFSISAVLLQGVLGLLAAMAVILFGVSFFRGPKLPQPLRVAGAVSALYLAITTLLGFQFHPHYLLILFPFGSMIIASAVWHLTPKRSALFLGTFVAAQFGLSLVSLCFLRQNGGAPHGDFGVSYGQQVENLRTKRSHQP